MSSRESTSSDWDHNQWDPLLVLFFHHEKGAAVRDVLGVPSLLQVSQTCHFAMLNGLGLGLASEHFEVPPEVAWTKDDAELPYVAGNCLQLTHFVTEATPTGACVSSIALCVSCFAYNSTYNTHTRPPADPRFV